MDWIIERLEHCDSTMDEAVARAKAGAPAGTVVLATHMDEGRGRHGRSWASPEGGLYLSLVLRDLPDPRFLTMALGNAVADALEVAGAEPRLKWVNDVFVADRKIAGILVEAESTGDHIDFVVAGIGINVNGSAADWGTPLSESATTLQDVLGAEVCMEDLEALLLDEVARWIEVVRQGRGEEVLAAWRAREYLVGKRIGLDPDGDLCSKIVGVVQGVDEMGRLLLETDDGVQAFDDGTIFTME